VTGLYAILVYLRLYSDNCPSCIGFLTEVRMKMLQWIGQKVSAKLPIPFYWFYNV